MRARPWPLELRALAAFALLTALLFAPVLFLGRTFYVRDLTYQYYPGYVFLERSLRQGVWPLWNPQLDAGTPALPWYPLDVLLTALTGARGALRYGPPLHVLLAMSGMFHLARRRGTPAWGAWAAGAFYGLSGLVLSSVCLLQLLQAAAWAPWVVAAFVAAVEAPDPRRIAALAGLAALQLSTLSAETALQTLLFAVVLLPRPPGRRALLALAAAGALAAALAAPILLSAVSNLSGTSRSRGLDVGAALADSASAGVLVEAVVPGFLGDVHTMTERGFWGAPLFATGFPYFPSLYLGPIVLLFAWQSRSVRLLAIALAGVLLALGAHGPFAPILAVGAHFFRAPVKFLFLTTLALSLAAGRGLADATSAPAGRRFPLALVALGFSALAGATLAAQSPSSLAGLCARLVPGASLPAVAEVVAAGWPRALITTGLLALLSGATLLAPAAVRPLVLLPAVVELLLVNGAINPTAPAGFFELRAPARALFASTAPGPWRLFTVSAEGQALHWDPALVARNRDLPLYGLDRQSLVPATHVIDGLDAAFGEDRTGFAPLGATLPVEERAPQALPHVLPRLRLANVRYVLSLLPLPAELVRPVGEARLAEVAEPLRLYEVPDALPRAFFLADLDAPVPRQPIPVAYVSPDPHHVVLTASTPPGFIVVLDGFDPRWRLAGGTGPILNWGGRYRALRTPGGDQTFVLSFVQPYLALALALSAGAVGALTLAAFRRIALDTSRSKGLPFRD